MGSKKPKKQRKSQSDVFSFSVDPRGGPEKIMRDLQKLIEEHGLTSIDEVNTFMKGLTASGGFIPESPIYAGASSTGKCVVVSGQKTAGYRTLSGYVASEPE